MIKSILLAFDGSAYSRSVYDCGEWLASKLKARMTGVHVVDVVQLEGPFLHDLSGSLGIEPYLDFSTKVKELLEQRGTDVLEDFKAESVQDRLDVTATLLSGIVPNEICKKAELYDVLIVGRKGMNAEYEKGLLGSVTESIIRKSPIPVIVVPEKFEPPVSAVLAYDGSTSATATLKSAASMAKELKLNLSVVCADSDPKSCETHLKDAEEYLSNHGVKATFTRVDKDSPRDLAEHIRQECNDFVFMGATHHSAVLEMVLGSTTEHVMRSIEVPFFIQR